MRVLVVGGTGFLGAAVAKAAIAAGHDTTVLTRGGTDVASGARVLVGDRLALPDLSGQFDGVIDTCAYTPAHIAHLQSALGPVAHYTLVSSISAYDDLSPPGLDETATSTAASPAQIAAHPVAERGADAMAYGADYGPLKRSCEERALDWQPGAALIRLGLIVGPGDKTDRFTWWVRRLDQGGPVPVPQDQKLQLIDVGDAARFLVQLMQDGWGGIVNVTGEVMALQTALDEMRDVTGGDATLVPCPIADFATAGVAFWTGLPLVVPPDAGADGMMQVSTDLARGLGLVTRPLRDTIRDTLAWDRARRATPLKCGLTPDQEAAVLKVGAGHNPSG